jgi:hypothetical protein
MERSDKTGGEHFTRAVVPGHNVRVTAESARVMVPRPDGYCEPQVALVRDGDVIQAIDVTCSCGQRIRLRCAYE